MLAAHQLMEVVQDYLTSQTLAENCPVRSVTV